MPQNSHKKQSLTRRAPKQGRAQEKIELILEAATRIIDKDGLEGLTTNRIAELAGISIGTLYQYFGSKAAILEVLGQREMKTVNENIIATLSNSNSGESQEPARILIDCVFGAFGGRSRVHRELLEYAWQMGHANNIDASSKLIANSLATKGVPNANGQAIRFSPEEAFVITHAFTGVIRASIGQSAKEMSIEEIKIKLLFLIKSFVNAKKANDLARTGK